MVRWSRGLPVLFVVVLLSGCMESDPDNDLGPDTGSSDPDNDGTNEGNVPPNGTTSGDDDLPPFTFNATGCNAVVLLAIDDYGVIEDVIPAGFIPADVVSLLRLSFVSGEVHLGQGAIGVVTVHCQQSDLTGGPFSIATAGALVETPELSQVNTSWVDGYQGRFATDAPAIAELFTQYGWPVDEGLEMDLAVLVDEDSHDEAGESAIPGSAVGQVTGTIADTMVFDGIVTASTTYHTSNAQTDAIRFWHDTPLGLSYFENQVDVHGKSGAADCSFGGDYAELTGRTECEPGSAIGIVVADFELRTTLVRLDGIHA